MGIILWDFIKRAQGEVLSGLLNNSILEIAVFPACGATGGL